MAEGGRVPEGRQAPEDGPLEGDADRAPVRWAEGWAPASVGNVSVGFDLVGHTLAVAGDRVRVELDPAVRGVVVEGVEDEGGTPIPGIPLEPVRNTAGAALLAFLDATGLGAEAGLRVRIRKGIPLGSGMGGSAASAVAALVAAERVLRPVLGVAPGDALARAEALYPFALAGEAVASGAPHGDNVGPQLLGGVVLALPDRLVRLPLPLPLHCALVHPHQVLETRRARAVLADLFPLEDVVVQSGRLARFVAACLSGDAGLMEGTIADALVEPRRAPLIPGFERAREAALGAGALGAGISGGGPSVFGWFRDAESAARGASGMAAAFAGAGVASDAWSAPVEGPSARIVACG